jgi:adenylosuccinate synthase
MNSVSAVIGANYGDEGKGLITNYLSRERSLVVRFNGGAQAGHTVVNSDGRRHVFHHVGSGSFKRAGTFLSRFFYVNPLLWAIESGEMARVGLVPRIWIDPRAPVTIPFDMMLNQAIEQKRGNLRHGSCGAGLWETQLREQAYYRLHWEDINTATVPELRDALELIRKEWLPKRMDALKLKPEDIPTLENRDIDTRWLKDAVYMTRNTQMMLWGPASKMDLATNLVFEGAQGLRLSETNVADMPYLTPSDTGLRNVDVLLAEIGYHDKVDVYYVTRTYITRHGAGPLPHERVWVPKEWSDDTNVENTWQQKLRFAPFDLDHFVTHVHRDLVSNSRGRAFVPHLAVTHCDQTPLISARTGAPGTIEGWERGQLDPDTFVDRLLHATHFQDALMSFGPTAADIRPR